MPQTSVKPDPTYCEQHKCPNRNCIGMSHTSVKPHAAAVRAAREITQTPCRIGEDEMIADFAAIITAKYELLLDAVEKMLQCSAIQAACGQCSQPVERMLAQIRGEQ